MSKTAEDVRDALSKLVQCLSAFLHHASADFIISEWSVVGYRLSVVSCQLSLGGW
jgi:hypothetical protein